MIKVQKLKSKIQNYNLKLKTFGFLVLGLPVARAQSLCNEVPLPLIGTGNIKPCESPAAYIAYWFYLSLYLAGIAALLAMVGGGVLWMISGTISSAQKGRSMMQNAALGLILLFGGWLILKTLNPALLNVQNPNFFGLTTTCSANFVPKVVATAAQKTTLFWSMANKDVATVSLTCIDPKGILFVGNSKEGEKISPVDHRDFPNINTGESTCTIEGFNSNKVKLDACSATITSLTSPCGLNQTRDILSWTVEIPNKGDAQADLVCDDPIIALKFLNLGIFTITHTRSARIMDRGGGNSGAVTISSATSTCHINILTGTSLGGNSINNACRLQVKPF